MQVGAGRSGQERSFGLSVGSVCCLLAGFFYWRGRIVAVEILGAVGVSLVTLALAWPPALKVPSRVWAAFSRILGRINARILLLAMFFLILTPVAFVRRMLGHDPLQRRKASQTGWTAYPARYRDKKHYGRLY